MTSRALAVCCCAALLTFVLAGCGGNTAIPPATTTGVATNQLTVADVPEIVDGLVNGQRVARLVFTADDLAKT